MYLSCPDVIVTPNGGEPVEIMAGDMAVFPAGMRFEAHRICTDIYKMHSYTNKLDLCRNAK